MPSELSKYKVLRQKNFLGQYGKIENVIIDNIGANQQIPDSGRVYVTFSREEEAVRCIEAVNGYILDGRPLKATFGVTRYCHVWLSNKVCVKCLNQSVYKPTNSELTVNRVDDVKCSICQATQKGVGGVNVYSYWNYPFSPSSVDIAATQRSLDFMIVWILNPLVYGDYPEIMKKKAGSRIPSFTKEQSELIRGSIDFIAHMRTRLDCKDLMKDMQC